MYRLIDFFPGIHYEGAILNHGLIDGFTADQQKPCTLFSCDKVRDLVFCTQPYECI